ncbi:MAG: hypothetical protein IJV33_10005 [Bacteroidaceae bacterium]|nr:hypothetical protein [Bacteroidaceae bacterium]
MKHLSHLLFLLLASLLVSCSEDAPQVDLQDVTTPFLPAADDTSEEAQMRRAFYQDYGSFLLFNDTLQHRLLGTDVNGDPHYFTEVLDLPYEIGMSTASNTHYTYTLLADTPSRRTAMQYVRDYLLPHFSGVLMPYSWLLVDQIQRENLGNISSPYAAAGQRAVVVACHLLPQLTDAQRAQFTAQVINIIIGRLVTDNAAAFTDFLAVSQAYYDGTFTAPSTTAENTALLNAAGFICRGQSYGTDVNGLYPSPSLDLSAFARLVVANSEETLQTRYEQYPLVLKKCTLMRQILKSLGYVE